MLRKLKSLKIKSIKLFTLNIDKYISMNFVIFDEIDDKLTIVCFIRYFYIVNNFKANILFNNNIFDLKRLLVNISIISVITSTILINISDISIVILNIITLTFSIIY